MIARVVSTVSLAADNDNQTSFDDGMTYEFAHSCGRFIRIDAYDLDYDLGEHGNVYFYEYSGYLCFREWISLAYLQCRIEDALGWNTKIVISWANDYRE